MSLPKPEDIRKIQAMMEESLQQKLEKIINDKIQAAFSKPFATKARIDFDSEHRPVIEIICKALQDLGWKVFIFSPPSFKNDQENYLEITFPGESQNV